MCKFIHLLFVTGCVLSCCNNCAVGSDADRTRLSSYWHDTVEQDIIEKSSKFDNSYTVVGNTSYTIERNGEPLTKYVQHEKISIRSGYSLAEIYRDPNDSNAFNIVSCVNPSYFFQLSRSKGGTDWVYNGIMNQPVDSKYLSMHSNFTSKCSAFLLQLPDGTFLNSLHILELSGFDNYSASTEGDKKIIKFSFNTAGTLPCSVELRFSLNNLSMPIYYKRSITRSNSETTTSEQELRYRQNNKTAGFEISITEKEVVSKNGVQKSKSTSESTFDYTSSPLEESAFRLSTYGFPEPEGVVWEKPTPSYVWYLSIGDGSLALSFLCGWLLKRRAKARTEAATTTSAPPNPPTKPM